MAEYRVQVTVEVTFEVTFEVTVEAAQWRASMSAGGGGDARFFAAQRPHRKKFVPAWIAGCSQRDKPGSLSALFRSLLSRQSIVEMRGYRQEFVFHSIAPLCSVNRGHQLPRSVSVRSSLPFFSNALRHDTMPSSIQY